MKTSVEFVNHASVIVSDSNISVLSDPWFEGNAFHKGWNLLHETSHEEVERVLDQISHIWISHEHPDHFSIQFFKTFQEKIKNNSIQILFQKTADKRVYNFLNTLNFDIRELEYNSKISLSENFHITCIKDGFYDSALLTESHSEKILNLNDCEVTNTKRANEVLNVTGPVDVLLTQFSFAAWKGGKNNKKWRDEAASEKINTIKLQIEAFKPKFLIPFASFVYFSNFDNFYLNDAANTPETLKEKLRECPVKIVLMAPRHILGGVSETLNEADAINFWKEKYSKISPLNKYDTIELNILKKSFLKYCERIEKNNNLTLIKILRKITPVRAFDPVIIYLEDLKAKVSFDYVKKRFFQTDADPMLSMKSESLDFIFNNSFGFDTLTVNGCFEEENKNGFVNSTKTLAIENLNNLGIKIQIDTIFNFKIIRLFLVRLLRASRKLKTDIKDLSN